MLGAEKAAGAADAGLDLVEDEQQAMAVGEGPQLLQEVVGCWEDYSGSNGNTIRVRFSTGTQALDRVALGESFDLIVCAPSCADVLREGLRDRGSCNRRLAISAS